MNDIWEYVILLKEEAVELGTNNLLKDIYSQLPFFSCFNLFYSSEYQKDITKYLYCEDTKTPPYKGGYGNTPNIWKEKHFLIKHALSILYQEKKDEITNKHLKKHGNR